MDSLACVRDTLSAMALAALLLGTPGCTQEAPESPSPHPFEAVLDGDNLAKFRGLPSEFQNALRQESEETSIATALRYLRDLPEEPTPIAELLSTEALGKFGKLSPRSQRTVLLGYDEAFKERPGQDPAELPTPSTILAGMVDLVHEMEFGDGKVLLPPMAETLSREALAKLDSVDPKMRRAFELIWTHWREPPESVDVRVGRLEEALIAAPNTLPEFEDIGLSAYSLELLGEVPAAKRFVVEWLAAEIVRDVGWLTSAAAWIDGFLGQFRTSEDRADLARLYLPSRSGVEHVACHFGPAFGVWPTWALPDVFRDVPPSQLMARWPSHREALSPAALARLDTLDPRLQEAFGEYWYKAGPLPMRAKLMACLTLRWNLKLEHIAFTELPPLESVLSDEALVQYDTLTDRERYYIERELVRGILEGELWDTTTVYLHSLSTEDVLRAVREWAEAKIRRAAARTPSR